MRSEEAVQQGIRTLSYFRASNVSGDFVPGGTTGQLSGEYRREYIEAYEQGRLLYTVRSYRTPIAWLVRPAKGLWGSEPYWVIPEARYSQTTSRHQNMVRRAISALPKEK